MLSKIWHSWTYLQNKKKLIEDELMVTTGERGVEKGKLEIGD